MVAKMPLSGAVSTDVPVDRRPAYCLLSTSEWATYRCLETARELSDAGEDVRTRAFWRFFKAHEPFLARWAERNHYYDQTLRYPDPFDMASELVREVLNAFGNRVRQGYYHVTQSRPCAYVRRSIENRNTDLLRRGGHPSQEECLACWEEYEGCPSFSAVHPWEGDYRRCYRPPQITSFEDHEALFSAAGEQQAWPPRLSESATGLDARRPVEKIALNHVLITELMNSLLSLRERIILIRTCVDNDTGPDIAYDMGLTTDNVYKIKQRALHRLLKALTS